jgi:hypothetical protein
MSGKSATGMFGWYSNAADADLGEQLQKRNTGLPMFLHKDFESFLGVFCHHEAIMFKYDLIAEMMEC